MQAAVERGCRARGGAPIPQHEDPARRLSRYACAFGVEDPLELLCAHVSSHPEQRASVAAELDLVDAAPAAADELLPGRRLAQHRRELDLRAAAPQAVGDLAEAGVTGAVGVPDRSEHE